MENKRVSRHILFWLLLLAILTFLEVQINSLPLGFAIANEFIRIVFYALLIYCNIYFLIPRYLNERKLILYGVFLVILIALVTPLMVTVLYWNARAYPDLQAQVLEQKAGYYLLNFIITSTFTIVKIISDWVRSERETRKIRTETMQSELRFLKSQINPHFLFNTLNSLYALTIKKSDLAPEIVLRLADMMRYMLYECNEKWVPLQREITYIENYLELEKLRHGDRAEVILDVQGEVLNQRIAPLMFIPFLENSFKHGLSRVLNQGHVEIHLTIKGNQIHFSIANSKPEQLPIPEGRRFGGIGLSNVRKRLDLLYPGNYSLSIENEPSVFRVILMINLLEE